MSPELLAAQVAAVEWRPTDLLAVGLAFSDIDIQVDATTETDYPAIDFLGGIGLRHSGLNLYAALRAL